MNQSAEESVWLKLLKESTTKFSPSDSLIILVGDVETNKKSLLQYLCTTSNNNLSKNSSSTSSNNNNNNNNNNNITVNLNGTNNNNNLNSNPTSTTAANINEEIFSRLLENMNYDYFDIEENLLESAIPTRVNIWTMDHRLFLNFHDVLDSQESNDQRLLFLIALELTKGEEVLISLKRWVKLIIRFIQEYFTAHRERKKTSLQQLWYSYISTARINRGSKLQLEDRETEDKEHETDLHTQALESAFHLGYEKLPFPVVAVGYNHSHISTILQNPNSSTSANASTANINELLQVNKFKELIGKLRYYCLDLGISLLLVPSFAENISVSSNLLKRYIVHRLYPEQVPLELGIEERLDRVFVPSGFDTIDLIQISSGVKYQEKEFSYLSWISTVADLESSTVSKSLNAVNHQSTVDVENEQDWLQGLHNFLSQGAGEGSSGKVATNLSDALVEGEATTFNVEPQEKRKSLTSNLSSNNLPQASLSSSTSTTANNSKNPSPHKGDGSSTQSSSNASGAAKTIPRRSSARTNTTASATNTQDFFKSLLEGNPKK